MTDFANLLSAVRDRVMEKSTVGLGYSTNIVVQPTSKEMQELGGVSPFQTQKDVAAGATLSSVSYYAPQEITFPTYDTLFAPEYSYSYRYSSLPRVSVPEESTAPVTVVDAPSREMLKRVPVDTSNVDLTDARQALATEAEALLGYMPLRKELRMPGTLKRVLAKLEISILEESSVNAYKNQMAKHYSTSGKMVDPTWRLTALNEYSQPVPEFVLHKAIEIKRELPEALFYVEQLAIDPFLIVSLTELHDYMSMWNTLSRAIDPETAAYVEVWSEPKFEASM